MGLCIGGSGKHVLFAGSINSIAPVRRNNNACAATTSLAAVAEASTFVGPLAVVGVSG